MDNKNDNIWHSYINDSENENIWHSYINDLIVKMSNELDDLNVRFRNLMLTIETFKQNRINQSKIPGLKNMIDKIYNILHSIDTKIYVIRYHFSECDNYIDDMKVILNPIIEFQFQFILYIKSENIPHGKIAHRKKYIFKKDDCPYCHGKNKTLENYYNNCNHPICPSCYLQTGLICPVCTGF
jgi:hypothetical protein